MIQDIFPSRLDNSYRDISASDSDNGYMMICDGGKLLANICGEGLRFPRIDEVKAEKTVYLFLLDDERFFLSLDENISETNSGFALYSIRDLRDKCSGKYLFAAFTAFHLAEWYRSNRFCGRCGGIMKCDDNERALVCTECGGKVYPRINPAVIVGVVNGDKILITRYNRGYAHNALIAGFTEIGETLEQTVEREVMEEAGIKVKNIRYYKSQPWGMASDLLAGFFCEVDGDDTIKMDSSELKYAQWLGREEIELQPYEHSLTNEMMKLFKNGGKI